ncbi:Uncharacterized protein APZ42_005039, partial [Daphnia magna]
RPSVNNPTGNVRRPAVPSDHEFLTNSYGHHPKNFASGEGKKPLLNSHQHLMLMMEIQAKVV